MKNEKIYIEYLPLEQLQRWKRNPKEHELGDISDSIKRFGYTNPIIIDEKSGKMVAGHGRVDTLTAQREAGEEPPKRIRADNGDWLVPVVRGVEFENEQEAEAYLMADNQLTMLADWDNEALAEMLLDQSDLSGVGFSAEDVDEIFKSVTMPSDEDWASQFEDAGDTSSVDGRKSITFIMPEASHTKLLEHLRTFDKNNHKALVLWLENSLLGQ